MNHALPRLPTTRRRCLGLGPEHWFESEGKSNRICKACAEKNRHVVESKVVRQAQERECS